MENYVSEQLMIFCQSAVLGLVWGAAYDLLRTVRRQIPRRWLTHALDAAYAAAVLLMIFLFTLHRGEGELRLYMLLAMVLGGVLYFAALGAFFAPVWRFWTEVLGAFMALLWKPVAFILLCGKNFQIYIKKLFYFYQRYATIGK